MIGPDGRPALDVLVVGAGMCGQTLAFALLRLGVRNLRLIDRARAGCEGPWGTYARMTRLRSPKHLTGPDLGVPSLTFRAWFEAQHGAAAWATLGKIDRLDWLAYLRWLRQLLALPVENEVELVDLVAAGSLLRATLRRGDGGREILHAREVVLATGRDGSGDRYRPAFPSLPAGTMHPALFHSADAIDMAAFAGSKIAVLGAGASAFDNAAAALEAGASSVAQFARRLQLPQVNRFKWMSFPGFQEGFIELDDQTRWQFMTMAFGDQVPPPHQSVLRCTRHQGYALRLGEPWRDVLVEPAGVTIVTDAGRHHVAAVIFATGFSVEPALRPELAAFLPDIARWADRIAPGLAAEAPALAAYPYLGKGFELTARDPGAAPHIGRVRLFNHGATLTHGALAGDIPGLGPGAERLARSIAKALFLADAEAHLAAMAAFAEPELLPTPYFVPPRP